MMSVFALLLTSCKTLNAVDVLPDINFPKFPISPSDTGIEYSTADGNIIITWIYKKQQAIIPIDIWEEIIEFVVDVDTAKKKYEVLQKTYAVQE